MKKLILLAFFLTGCSAGMSTEQAQINQTLASAHNSLVNRVLALEAKLQKESENQKK